MKRWVRGFSGLTIVELLMVIVALGILVGVAIVGYVGVQKKAASTHVVSTAKDASDAVELAATRAGVSELANLPSDFKIPKDITVTYDSLSNKHYSNLSSVQSGVLFYEICKNLVASPKYSTIHSKDGAQTSTVVMSCDDNIQRNKLQITGWDSKTWSTPLTKTQLEQYIASVPSDAWWIDRQAIVRGFYTALITTYTASGGDWPITSFWDPWANQWSGVQKQELPAPDPSTRGVNYCIEATHKKYTDVTYIVTADDPKPHAGTCF